MEESNLSKRKDLGYLSLVECFFRWIGVDHSILEKEVKPVNSWETGLLRVLFF